MKKNIYAIAQEITININSAISIITILETLIIVIIYTMIEIITLLIILDVVEIIINSYINCNNVT